MKKLIAVIMSIVTLFMSATEILALSKRGSTGTEVRNIQTRLKNWGYLNGGVDGIYGAKTEEAVKKFQ